MKVKCIANTGEDLPEESIKAGKLRTTIFPIEVGKVYIVYGISSWKGRLEYFLDAPVGVPGWYPAELFEMVDHLLPIGWYFEGRKSTFFSRFSAPKRNCIWSYKEMVLIPEHLIELLEAEESEATEIFQQRKEEIDEYDNLRKVE